MHIMGKIVAIGMAVGLLLTGCGEKERSLSSGEQEQMAAAIGAGFDAKATVKMGGIEAEVDINRTSEGVCTMVLTKPKGLSGMTFQFDRETVTVGYLGLHMKLDSASLLSSAMTEAVVSSINKVAEPHGVKMSVKGEVLSVFGATESGDFTLTIDRANQSMLKLSIPNMDLECNFSPFSK
ncbi:MAG: hypothetical protein RR977_00360 [Oscillospiraceae bacterium]